MSIKYNRKFDVTTAADGVYGMQLLKETKVDLILLDILMPGPDGYQVLQSIRERSSVPIIMIAGIHGSDSVAKSLELGADDYITKPFNKAILLARIRSKLRHSEN